MILTPIVTVGKKRYTVMTGRDWQALPVHLQPPYALFDSMHGAHRALAELKSREASPDNYHWGGTVIPEYGLLVEVLEPEFNEWGEVCL